MEDSNGLSYFTWDTNGMNLLQERDASGGVTAGYTHGYTPIDGIGSMVAANRTASGATYYQYPVYDHRGTVVRLTDADGEAAVATYEYDAWGTPLQASVSSPTAPNRFRYQSNWIDLVDSGGDLLLSPTRVYHAGVGRFLQRDLLAVTRMGASTRLGGDYWYSTGNALLFVDALGRKRVNVTHTCAGTGRRIEVEYECCTPRQRRIMGRRLCSVFPALTDVLGDLDLAAVSSVEQYVSSSSWQPSAAARRGVIAALAGKRGRLLQRLAQWFGPVDGMPKDAPHPHPITPAQLQTIARVYTKARNAFWSRMSIKCAGASWEYCKSGDVIAKVIGKRIHTCPAFWRSGRTPRQQASTMVHELTHAYAGTLDYGMYVASPPPDEIPEWWPERRSYTFFRNTGPMWRRFSLNIADVYSSFLEEEGYLK